jgi:predicted transcriptional regulator
MKVLWGSQKLSAREVHERLAEEQGWAYSTTRTVLERMVGKGLVEKGQFHGIYLYRPAISKAAGLAPLVREFASRVLEMDARPVVSLFAEAGSLTEDEVAELARILERDGGEEASS